MKSYVTVLAFLVAIIMYACGGVSSTLTDPNESPGGVTGKVDKNGNGGGGGAADGGMGVTGDTARSVYAILIDKDGARQVSKTGDDGAFAFSNVLSGDLTLILNDLHGQGAIRRMVIIGGGSNDVGTFTLSPLEKQPEVFGFANIGFEEKITESYGDHLQPRFASDASFAVSFQKLPGSKKYDIVRTAIADGTEKVLVKDEDLAGSDYVTPWVMGSTDVFKAGLFEDRFLLYYANRTYEQDPQYTSEHVVAYDLSSGKSFVNPVEDGTTFFTKVADQQVCRETYPGDPNPQDCATFSADTYIYDRGHTFVDSKYYYLQKVSQESFTTTQMQGGFGMYVGEKVEFCAFNPADGSRSCVPVNDYDAYKSFDAAKFGKDAVFTQMGRRPCDPQDFWQGMGTSGCFGQYTAGAPIVAIGYKDMKKKTYADPEAADFILSADQTKLVYTTPDRGAITTSLVIVDLGTDKETTLATAALGDLNNPDQYRYPVLSPDGNHVGLTVAKGTGNGYGGTFLVASVAKKTTIAFDGKVTYKNVQLGTSGSGYSYVWNGCTSDYYKCFTDDGKYFTANMYFSNETYKAAFGADIAGGLQSVYLVLKMPVEGGTPVVEETAALPTVSASYDSQPPAQSPDTSLAAEVTRVKDTGFNQLFVRAPGAKDGTQITFITAQHSDFAWTPDSRYLVYMTRDPVTGYNQFFRVIPRAFLDPEKTLRE